MFTGIVEETGSVKKVIGHQVSGYIEIKAKKVLEGTQIGDSIAVNGVCLTVTELHGDSFVADVMAETLRKTNLGNLSIGAKVNLERAMAANGRFGGHIVSGHIDGTGTIQSLQPEGNAVWVTIAAPASILHLIVNKGSIAIDGISLTVAYIDDKVFKVSIIPHTGEETTLLKRKPGDVVNLENDVVAKYIEKLIKPYAGQEASEAENSLSTPASQTYGGNQGGSGITMDFLARHGF